MYVDKTFKVSRRFVIEHTLIIALVGRKGHGTVHSKQKCMFMYNSIISLSGVLFLLITFEPSPMLLYSLYFFKRNECVAQ